MNYSYSVSRSYFISTSLKLLTYFTFIYFVTLLTYSSLYNTDCFKAVSHFNKQGNVVKLMKQIQFELKQRYRRQSCDLSV